MDTPSEKGVSHGLNQDQLLEAIGVGSETGNWGDLRTWGAVYSHRQACVRFIRDTVLDLLDDPSMTRRRLREQVLAVCRQVEEHGP